MHASITLNNRLTIPQIGLGVWQAKNGSEVENAVTAAINAGYRLVDTAAAYGNEKGVGNAIRTSNVARSELFITTKLWNADQGYEQTLRAFDKSLQRLGLDYIDLYLIHWPTPSANKYIESWRAMEKLHADGKVKTIGVSNFTIPHLERLLQQATITPAVNQIELHPYYQQRQLRDYCQTHHIAVEAYSPLSGGGGTLLQEPILARIAESYGVSPAQVVIRWHIQNGFIVIPKSINADRIVENYNVFGFELTPHEMAAINSLETGNRVGADPETTNIAVNTTIVQFAHKLGLVHW